MDIEEVMARALYSAQGGTWENAKDISKNLGGGDDETVAAFYQAQECLTALREAGFEVLPDWKPIDTAPETSPCEPIALYSDARNITAYRCFRDGSTWVSRYMYIDNQGRRCTRFDAFPNPTHWMPSLEGLRKALIAAAQE